ncbi:BadF/BadG/BcrA/BcrD ATPase family protein [uncultured Microbulbifer sp.]|uniref:BadF/BadG/BcrA/BcrD ATPase family protein n=1 Tax=uncultured Microbulbifer sp. TaxID=348147 RepID=UPI0025E29977|nr:BadF/BadG/BcrA/BcrD ATPase family protein [uncultured Microbulbifer sp.]
MSEYFVGIDGGGTKTLARIGRGRETLLELRAEGSSLTQNPDEAGSTVIGLCRQLLARQRIKPQQVSVACGLAGAGNTVAANQLTTRLKEVGFSDVVVTSDAQTSLLGAGAGLPIVVVAVGTGSVAMRLSRSGNVRQFGGWGLAIGDEGSGAAIGKSAVRTLLWELDIHGRAVSELCQHVMAEVGMQRPTILGWLREAGPREYAALAPTVFEHLPNCQQAKDIITKTAGEIDRLIAAANEEEDLPLALLGGLADKLSPFLSEAHQQKLIAPFGTALDGACMLARKDARLEKAPAQPA